MTKQHFQAMAVIVASILQGEWTSYAPSWADSPRYRSANNQDDDYTRAVQTAEAFIHIAEQENARFDRQRFLVACGLVDAAKVRKVRTPTLGACGCKRGIERDNCPACEGTGKRIDFAAIRACNAK